MQLARTVAIAAVLPGMSVKVRRGTDILLLFAVLAAGPASVRGIEVGSTISCSLDNLEYLDISSLECVRCDDDRCSS